MVPSLFGPQLVSWKTAFPRIGAGVGGGFWMIQACYIYCALYFYEYCISSSSDLQALDPRGWGSLLLHYQNLPWVLILVYVGLPISVSPDQ